MYWIPLHQALEDRGIEVYLVNGQCDKAKFWESMTATRGEMTGLWDRRLANIKLYAQNLDNKMTDPIAD